MSDIYANEFDPFAASWLRELMADGHIPAGTVDERSIKDVAADDVRGFGQCHFFAGIGGWPLALDLAGWGDRPVWSGSAPCQPYSSAGKQQGNADARDLWPDFFRLIRECRPQCVLGEQVPGAIKHGWLDRIHADLEPEGYTVGAVVLTAAGAGAPHIRQRLYWVAHTGKYRRDIERGVDGEQSRTRSGRDQPLNGNESRGVFHPTSDGRRQGRAEPVRGSAAGGRGASGLDNALFGRRDERDGRTAALANGDGANDGLPRASGERAVGVALGDTDESRPQGRGVSGSERASECVAGAAGGDVGSFWSDSRLILCRDGKRRRIPVEPGLFPLVAGISGRVAVVRSGQQPEAANPEEIRYANRVGALRGAGNAICVPTAVAFVRAFLAATPSFLTVS